MKFAGPPQDLLISERGRIRLGTLLGRVMFHEDSSTPKHFCEKDHGHSPFSPLPLFMICATVPVFYSHLCFSCHSQLHFTTKPQSHWLKVRESLGGA